MYLLFGGDRYYPGGGVNDFIGAYPTLEEAKVAAEGVFPYDEELADPNNPEDFAPLDWWHIATFQDGNFTTVSYSYTSMKFTSSKYDFTDTELGIF
jgi:ABC-type siderophore export system fused ATPase/permease subunit